MSSHKEKEDKKAAAKELINLTHVETKKQQVDQTGLAKMLEAKKSYDEKTIPTNKLSSEDQSIMASFQKKRMILERIWIIVNQSRSQTGMELLKQENIKERLNNLVLAGYLNHEEVEYDKKKNDVYILTEKGEEQIL